ncbi:MAG: TfoX/Sxy family protein [Bacteroidota bacterium]
MGQKGDKHTNETQLSADLLLEKLSSIRGITSKKMFGGHGIFHEGKMFGIVDSAGTFFFKTNDKTKLKYESLGSQTHAKMPYHTVPDSIFNSQELTDWAKESISLSKE